MQIAALSQRGEKHVLPHHEPSPEPPGRARADEQHLAHQWPLHAQYTKRQDPGEKGCDESTFMACLRAVAICPPLIAHHAHLRCCSRGVGSGSSLQLLLESRGKPRRCRASLVA